MPTFAPVDVSDVATLIVPADGRRQSALLINQELQTPVLGNSVFLGADANVTATPGVANTELVPQAPLTLTGDPGEVWGICASGQTARVDVTTSP